jgi:VWFA-related protein
MPRANRSISRRAFNSLLLSFPVVLSADDPPRFSGDVALVCVDVGVRDATGGTVADLTRSSFRLFDEGQEQPLVSFAAEEQPLDIVLLVDVSGSMQRAVQTFVDVGQVALAELRAGDRVAVMTFATDTNLLVSFTDDLQYAKETLAQLRGIRFYGNTHIDDGVYEAASLFLVLHEPEAVRRRAVLIFTDNVGWGRRSAESAIENIWEANATLSGLVADSRRSRGGPFGIHFPGGIDRLVAKTGGEMMRAADVGTSFPEAIRRIRSRYSLYYKLPDGAGSSVRSVRVELSAEAKRRYPSAAILARQGYRPPASDGKGFAVRQ